jgi:hypothetical protein
MAWSVVLENSRRCNQFPNLFSVLGTSRTIILGIWLSACHGVLEKGLTPPTLSREAMLRQTGNASSPIRLYVRMSAEDFRLPT